MSIDSMLNGLLPELAEKAKIHLARCSAKGIEVAVTSGYRTWGQQMENYQKGRARSPSGWQIVDRDQIVTLALPDHDPHCRGAAYDVVPIVDELAAWHRLDLFQAIADQAKGLCLTWGGDWPRFKDLCHYELPGWKYLPVKEEA